MTEVRWNAEEVIVSTVSFEGMICSIIRCRVAESVSTGGVLQSV